MLGIARSHTAEVNRYIVRGQQLDRLQLTPVLDELRDLRVEMGTTLSCSAEDLVRAGRLYQQLVASDRKLRDVLPDEEQRERLLGTTENHLRALRSNYQFTQEEPVSEPDSLASVNPDDGTAVGNIGAVQTPTSPVPVADAEPTWSLGNCEERIGGFERTLRLVAGSVQEIPSEETVNAFEDEPNRAWLQIIRHIHEAPVTLSQQGDGSGSRHSSKKADPPVSRPVRGPENRNQEPVTAAASDRPIRIEPPPVKAAGPGA